MIQGALTKLSINNTSSPNRYLHSIRCSVKRTVQPLQQCMTRCAADHATRSTVELHRASKRGDLMKVRRCLQEGAEVDIVDQNGSSPLMWAASNQKPDVVKELLEAGASPILRNDFGWTALEYNLERRGLVYTAAKAEAVRRLLLDAGAERQDTTVPPEMLGGGFARILHSAPFPTDVDGIREDVRYLFSSARSTLSDMMEARDSFAVGEVAISGVSGRRLGLYAGQRYLIKRLFYRKRGAWEAHESRIDVSSVSEKGGQPPAEIMSEADKWELCAELANETWMPWGSTEVAVELAELRSIKSELQWSLRLAAFASAFWLLVLPAALTVRLAFIPSGSMEPTVHQGDMLVYSPKQNQYSRGDIVLLTPPPKLTQLAFERGLPIQKGDLLVKRLVAISGDEVEVREGLLWVNGILESPPKTDRKCVSRCVKADYNFGPDVVPEGKVFLLGDNRGASTDSHVFGFVDQDTLMGKAFWRIVGEDKGPL